MKTITINDVAAPLLKQGLDLEKRMLEFSYNKYRRELEGLEKQHAMPTEEFVTRFNSGILGDNAEWFDWLFAYKALRHVEEKLRAIEVGDRQVYRSSS